MEWDKEWGRTEPEMVQDEVKFPLWNPVLVPTISLRYVFVVRCHISVTTLILAAKDKLELWSWQTKTRVLGILK